MRFWRFLTAMVSTYQQWLRILRAREDRLQKFANCGQDPSSRPLCFPSGWPREYVVEHALAEMLENQKRILKNQEAIMAKVADIDGKLDDLSQTVDEFIAANTPPVDAGGATDADLDRFGSKIDAIKSKLVTPASTQ